MASPDYAGTAFLLHEISNFFEGEAGSQYLTAQNLQGHHER